MGLVWGLSLLNSDRSLAREGTTGTKGQRVGTGTCCHPHHLTEVSIDYSWHQAVHSDAFWSQLHGQRLTEAQQGCLAGVVDSQLLKSKGKRQADRHGRRGSYPNQSCDSELQTKKICLPGASDL
jgi:hypothetical protein